MGKFLFILPDDHQDELKALSSREGEPMAAYVRKGVELVLECNRYLSGAMMLGIQVHMTSGSVWIKGV